MGFLLDLLKGLIIGFVVPVTFFLVGYLVYHFRKCRNISNLTDKLRKSYISAFHIKQCHGSYGAWKIIYWRICSCFGCSKCRSNESNTVAGNVSQYSPSAGTSHQRDEDANDDVDNEGDRLMIPLTEGRGYISIQCDKELNNLLGYEDLKTMSKKYEQYDLYRCNFIQVCPEDKCGHDPVIFLLILDWEQVIKYETGDKKDFYCDMFNVALSYGNRSPSDVGESILKLLKENKYTIVILQNFPENWEDIHVRMGLSDKAKIFLERIKSNVKSYYEYR